MLIFSTKEMAAVLQITPQALSKFAKAGMPKIGPGQWDPAAVIQWLIKRREARGDSPMVQQRKLLYAAQIEGIQLETAKRRETLIETAEMQRTLEWLRDTMSASLEDFGSEMRYKLVGVTDPAEIKDRIDDYARRLRAKVAAKVKAIAEAALTGNKHTGKQSAE